MTCLPHPGPSLAEEDAAGAAAREFAEGTPRLNVFAWSGFQNNFVSVALRAITSVFLQRVYALINCNLNACIMESTIIMVLYPE